LVLGVIEALDSPPALSILSYKDVVVRKIRRGKLYQKLERLIEGEILFGKHIGLWKFVYQHKMTGKRTLEAVEGRSKKPNVAQKQHNWKMLSLPIKRPEASTTLESNLSKMGLVALLDFPWIVKIVSIVQDFYQWKRTATSATIRANLDAWTTSFISEVYGIPNEAEIDYIKEDRDWALFFKIKACDIKVGWKVEHCLDKELGELMGFLLSSLTPIKPHRIIKSFASTLLAAWKEGR
jgi:hypothetical protein